MTAMTPQQRITLLKHVASGKPLDMVATITRLPRESVDSVAADHGYPDLAKVATAVTRLVADADTAVKLTLHTTPMSLRIPATRQRTLTPAAVTSTPAAAGLHSPEPATPSRGLGGDRPAAGA